MYPLLGNKLTCREQAGEAGGVKEWHIRNRGRSMELGIRFKLRENVTSVFKELLCGRGEIKMLWGMQMTHTLWQKVKKN